MSDSSNREALDGLLGAVAAAAGQSGPEWLEAYISLIANEYLDRHHVGLLVGLIRSANEEASTEWRDALATAEDDASHRWLLLRLITLAHQSDHAHEPSEIVDPFMRRLSCELEAFAFAERGEATDAMELRRALFESWPFDEEAQQIYLGLDLLDDLLALERLQEAKTLAERLNDMIEYVGTSEMRAELLDRVADIAREAHDHQRAREYYEEAKELLDGEYEGVYERLGLWTARINMLLQQGKLQRARELLEIPHTSESYPFIARVEQRRLTSLCQLCTTLEDKRALYETLETLVDNVIEVGWALFGTLDSHLDDLVNLACQFGDGERAKAFLTRGREVINDTEDEGWLSIAAIRIAIWEGREGDVAEMVKVALASPLMARDLFFCQSVLTLIEDYGGPTELEQIADALERCLASLNDRRLVVRASSALQYKAQRLTQAGQIEEARKAFKAAVELLEASGHYQTKVVGTAMEWATWEINGGHLDKLEVPIETMLTHSDDDSVPALMGRLSFQQAMYFAMNPPANEQEEDPKTVVGRWIALAAEQYIEGDRLSEANGVYMHLADWLDTQGEYEAATEILESVAQGALNAGDTELIWHAALIAANRLEQEGDGEASIQLLQTTLESCESEEPSTRGAQHFELANLLSVISEHERALEHYQIAQRNLTDGSVQDRARILMGIGICHWNLQHDDRALNHWRDALALAERSADRDFIADLSLGIDNHLLERLDRVGEVRIAMLEALIKLGDRCRWELIAHGSDLPLRLTEEYAHAGIEEDFVGETVHTLRTLADAVTNVGLPHDGTLLLQRAAGIEMLRGFHESGLGLMREVLDRIEGRSGTIVRARECLLQATMVAAGGLVHEAWDRVSEVRDWLATIEDEHPNERALDELTLTCQLQCANLHLLGEKPELVVAPLTELIATCDVSKDAWPAAQLARVTLAAAHTSLGQAGAANNVLKALEANLDQGTSGWFNGVIMAGRIGQRALGEAIIRGVQDTYGRSAPSRWSSTEISIACGTDWLRFMSGEAIDRTQTQRLAERALKTRHFSLATVVTLVSACYALDAGDTKEAQRAVAEAVELARRHWSLDEFGLMWGVLLPRELKQLAASLLEADRLQHVN